MHLAGMHTLPGLLRATAPVVAIHTHTLRIISLVGVWTLYDLLFLTAENLIGSFDALHCHRHGLSRCWPIQASFLTFDTGILPITVVDSACIDMHLVISGPRVTHAIATDGMTRSSSVSVVEDLSDRKLL